MTKVYCHECGFRNTEEGKYCSKCGALLPEEGEGPDATIRFSPESDEREAVFDSLTEVAREGISLVVRSGGGMAGETFEPAGEKTTLGRHPDSDIFLDDITVSRNHAVLIKKPDGFYIQDHGSLNGTYVNRVRVETHKLTDGDQVQVGKYKLTYIER